MKLVSSTPPPQHDHRNTTRNGALRHRMLGKIFSARTPDWLYAIIVAVFAFTIVCMFRHALELATQ